MPCSVDIPRRHVVFVRKTEEEKTWRTEVGVGGDGWTGRSDWQRNYGLGAMHEIRNQKRKCSD